MSCAALKRIVTVTAMVGLFLTALEGCHFFGATGQTQVFRAPDPTRFNFREQAGGPLSYTDNGDGTHTDDNTGLVWTETLPGQHTWEGAFVVVSALNRHCKDDQTVECSVDQDCIDAGAGTECGLAGHQDWRLPNVKELHSIVDYGKSNPAASIPRTLPSGYWSATPRQGAPATAWRVGFFSGNVRSVSKTFPLFVRAVRAGSE